MVKVFNRSPLWEKIERQRSDHAERQRLERQRVAIAKIREQSEAYERERRKREAELESYREAGRTKADRIVEEVAAEFNVTVAGIRGIVCSRWITVPRFKAAWRLYAETELTLTQIGKKIGRRDHSSAWHAILRHKVVNDLPWPEHRMHSAWRAASADPAKGLSRILRYNMKPAADALRNATP